MRGSAVLGGLRWESRAHLFFDNLVMVMKWHLTSRELRSRERSADDVLRDARDYFLDRYSDLDSRHARAGGFRLAGLRDELSQDQEWYMSLGFAVSSWASREPSIHVAKLLRAHGGCLGVRRR